jgi:hypothetical protein
MNRGRGGRSLGERAADSGVVPELAGSGLAGPELARPGVPGPSPTAVAGHPAAPADGGEGRHCWVHDPPEAAGTWPGLLVEWRRRDGAWQGRVTYAVSGPHGPALVEAWLPAARLEPR